MSTCPRKKFTSKPGVYGLIAPEYEPVTSSRAPQPFINVPIADATIAAYSGEINESNAAQYLQKLRKTCFPLTIASPIWYGLGTNHVPFY